jgi:hypothetical protein
MMHVYAGGAAHHRPRAIIMLLLSPSCMGVAIIVPALTLTSTQPQVRHKIEIGWTEKDGTTAEESFSRPVMHGPTQYQEARNKKKA